MTRILVLDPNASLTSAVVRCLRELGVEAVGHTRLEAAERSLGDGAVDLVLMDCSLSNGVARFGTRPIVMMVSYPDPWQQAALARRHRLLFKPFTSGELMSLLQQELGPLDLPPSSLFEALQNAHASSSSLCLVLDDVVEPAEIYMIQGEIHDARRGALRGEAALRALLERPLRVRDLAPIEICQRTIERSFRPVILDLLTEIEDAERVGVRPASEDGELK